MKQPTPITLNLQYMGGGLKCLLSES